MTEALTKLLSSVVNGLMANRDRADKALSERLLRQNPRDRLVEIYQRRDRVRLGKRHRPHQPDRRGSKHQRRTQPDDTNDSRDHVPIVPELPMCN